MRIIESPRLRQLEEHGYVVAPGVLNPATDVRPVVSEYEVVLDRLADQLYRDGELSSPHADLPFEQRLITITRECGRSLSQHFDISLPQGGITANTPIHLGPACFRLLTNPRLLDLAEDIIGPEILLSPVGHVRMKLPEATLPNGDGLMAKIPWHQDNGVVLPEADGSEVLTIWLPITPATEQNGCMRVIPSGRHDALRPHCPTASVGLRIPDAELDIGRSVTLPMEPGSVLVMHPRTIHSSLANQTSAQVRISMDLRYQPVGHPTGRPAFPEFVVRSRANPSSEVRDPLDWASAWREARSRLAAGGQRPFNRWDPDSPVCA